jgi:hypothetical protein
MEVYSNALGDESFRGVFDNAFTGAMSCCKQERRYPAHGKSYQL